MNVLTRTLPVASLEVCDRTRVRQLKPKPSSDIVQEYAEAYRCRLIVEPLDVFREKGTERCVVADGEHRLLALRQAKIAEVECRIHEGDEVDALDFAMRCNQKHGLRRTKADIYYAFTRIMEIPRLKNKYRTDTELSEQLGVSKRTVERYRVDWRNSEGGDRRTRKAKKEAQENASRRKPAGIEVVRATINEALDPTLSGSGGIESKGKIAEPTRKVLPDSAPIAVIPEIRPTATITDFNARRIADLEAQLAAANAEIERLKNENDALRERVAMMEEAV
jgi:hypothetical protein